MTATTLTPAAAGADLLDRLRQLLAEHETAETLDEVRTIADELTAVLRSARGRLGRLTRKATPRPETTPSAPAPKPAVVQPADRGPDRTPTAAPPPAPAAPPPAPAPPAEPDARGASMPRHALAAAVVVAVRIVAGVARAVRRAATVLHFRRRDGAADEPVPAVAREARPRAVDDELAAVPDLNNLQAHGLACTECRTDFYVSGALKVPVGVSETTGEPVFACIGECAYRAGHREPVGEQLELAAGQ